jgi:Na+-transporting NADH:ubiquinone oxidoreductase subunit NqrB
MIRSILAVLAGLVVLTLVSFAIEAAADPLLMHLFPQALPDAAALQGNLPARLFMLAYTTLSIGIGGYVTAWIARRSRLTLAAIMGAIEATFTLYVMIGAPFHVAHPTPPFVWITGLILMIPAACLGSAIRAKQAS